MISADDVRLRWHKDSREVPDRFIHHVAPHTPVPNTVLWERLAAPVLDQGNLGECVGYGWIDCMNMNPRDKTLGPANAQTLYTDAQTLGNEPLDNESGTTVMLGAEAAVKLGYIKNFTWATGSLAMAVALQHTPLVLGIPWYNNMFNPLPGGVLQGGGGIAGGHCVCVVGYSPLTGFRIRNSWGPSWGLNGDAFIPVSLMSQLVVSGECCVPGL